MAIKDYYDILEIQPGAGDAVIKKAYRRLAMRYHPDRNIGNAFASNHFREIQEAYDVLSDPVKRSEYHQKRWQYSSDQISKHPPIIITPSLLLAEARKMENYVSGIDIFRMNHQALQKLLARLCSETNIRILQESEQPEKNREIVNCILNIIRPLRYPNLVPLVPSIVQIAGTDNDLIESIDKEVKQKRIQYYLEKYNWLFVVLLALGISLMIYLLA